jgi:poly(3-hydroxybutyrate) depolymerase
VCRKQLYRQYSGVSLSTALHRSAVVRLRGQLLRFLCYIYQFELLCSCRVRCTAQAIVLQASPALSLPILLYVLASELSHPPYTDIVKLKIVMAGSIRFLTLCVLGLCLLLGQAYAGSSRGCGKSLNSKMKKGGTGQSNKISLTRSNGAKRTFLLHFPANYDKNKPHGLIFSFHGRSGTSAGQESLSKLSESGNNKNMLVAYPQGIDKQWQGDPAAKTDDIGFTMDMINSISDQYCVDPDRIYATGQSNGGGFSANILACDPQASRRIAAFAGVSGAYYQGSSDANCNPNTVVIHCNPGRKNVPVLEFHGKKDDTIPYNGGKRRNRCLPKIPHFMKAWANRNGYPISSADSSLYGGHVKKSEWGSGNLKGVNTHYAIDNMPHTWPNAKSVSTPLPPEPPPSPSQFQKLTTIPI